jgi:hypothetical protein
MLANRAYRLQAQAPRQCRCTGACGSVNAMNLPRTVLTYTWMDMEVRRRMLVFVVARGLVDVWRGAWELGRGSMGLHEISGPGRGISVAS